MANIFGTNGEDNLPGTESGDLIQGYPNGGDPNADTGNDVLGGHGGNDTLRGGGGDDLLNGGADTDTMVGGLGNDVYIVDIDADVVTEAAGEGTDRIRTALATYTLRPNVEELSFLPDSIGGSGPHIGHGNALNNRMQGWMSGDTLNGFDGHDTLIGHDGSDTLNGGIGDDTLIGDRQDSIGGRAYADVMRGGQGNDTYVVNLRTDQVIENAGEGIDEVQVLGLSEYTLGNNVEWLRLVGPNGFVASHNFIGEGNALDNRLDGGAGNDTLRGLGGFDVFLGGNGNDTFFGGAGDDYMDGQDGLDSVAYSNSVLNWTINLTTGRATEDTGTERDRFTRVENAVGGNGHDTLVGTTVANVLNGGGGIDELYGLGGRDTLIGGALGDTLDGGTAADLMKGGPGHDTYVVDNAGDNIDEFFGDGIDLVQTSVRTYVLELNVDNLTYTGIGGIEATGNALANIMIGLNGDDRLDGRGGADTLIGRGGHNTYLVDTASDMVTEAIGAGYDTVSANASYVLAAGVEVERLTTFGSATTTVVDLTGNEFTQYLYGNAAGTTLNGGGGVDRMWGYGNDDRYFVDNADDLVFETAGQGADSVIATASYVLGYEASVELLRTLGSASSYAVDLTGNELINTIQGNAAVNRINGRGGSDLLFGGTEDDTFVFDTFFFSGLPNIDAITDYNVTDDTIELDDVVFGLPLGVLAANAFRIGTAAADRDDRIIYDPATGAVIFDANGSLGSDGEQFATLSRGLSLTNNDFVVA